MCSPMFELPKHCLMPVNADGDGPCEEGEAVKIICWCGIEDGPGPTPENEHEVIE